MTCRYVSHIPPLRQNSYNSMEQALLQALNQAVLLFFTKSIIYVRKKKNHHISLVSYPTLAIKRNDTLNCSATGPWPDSAGCFTWSRQRTSVTSWSLSSKLLMVYQVYARFTELFRNRGFCPIYPKPQIHDVSPHLQLRSQSLQLSLSEIRLKPPLTQMATALICLIQKEKQ